MVDGINPALPQRPYVNYGNYGIFLMMGSAGPISSTVALAVNPKP